MNKTYHSIITKTTEYLGRILDLKELSDTNILLVGGSGMIGKVLVDILMELNRSKNLNLSIMTVGRSEASLKNAFYAYNDDKHFSAITHDVNKPFPDFGKYDFIIHAASNTHPMAYSTDPIGTITSNVIGTMNLLEYAYNYCAKRFVFLSSVEIYGEADKKQNAFAEKDFGYIDCNTVRAGYPEGKRVGESLCQAYSDQYGLDFVIPRLCRVYGPTMRSNDSKALAQFIKKAVNGEKIVLKSDGLQYYSYIDVFDAASAIIFVMLKGAKGEAYNISSKESDITLRELAEKLAKLAETSVMFEDPDELEKRGYSKATKAILDSSKLHSIGWKELFTIDEGLKITLDVLKEERYDKS